MFCRLCNGTYEKDISVQSTAMTKQMSDLPVLSKLYTIFTERVEVVGASVARKEVLINLAFLSRRVVIMSELRRMEECGRNLQNCLVYPLADS